MQFANLTFPGFVVYYNQKEKEKEILKMTTYYVTLEMTCPFCAYIDGALAQEAFPDLSPTQREQIISQMCPDCQRSVFGR